MSSLECSICCDAINATTGVATLSCSHSFHICCIASWFAKLEKGTCPCCRKEMSALEDLPPAAEADDSDDEDDEDEDEDDVEFSRADLDALMRARGGHGLNDAMAALICAESACFDSAELNALLIGNGARPLSMEEWVALLDEQDENDGDEEDEDEDEDDDAIAAAVAAVWNELASYDETPRAWLMVDGSWTSTVLNPEQATTVTVIASPAAAAGVAASAATKVQAVWRGFKGRLSLRM